MKLKNVIIVLWGAIILTSCATPKTVTYFPNLSDGDKMIVKESKGILLKPADKISIIVNTKSVELNNVLNLPVTSQIIGYTEQQSIYQSRGTSGYTIDQDGYIDFPLIGKVKTSVFLYLERSRILVSTYLTAINLQYYKLSVKLVT